MKIVNKTFKYSLISIILFNLSIFAQTEIKPSSELYKEAQSYSQTRMNELASNGKKMSRDLREDVEKEREKLAKKYAKEISSRSNLTPNDYFYIGALYEISKDEEEAMNAFLNYTKEFPNDQKGNSIQEARSRVIMYSANRKELEVMEKTYDDWVNSEPVDKSQKALLQEYVAVAFYKDKQYEKSIEHAESSLAILEKLEEKSWSERKRKEKLYANLIEVLAFAYKKDDRKEDATNILAEGRALSFTIPSAELYRRVMQIVNNSGISEKKLMQKVESISTAEPAPEIDITEWIGQEPTTLQNLRGKVVLLDFWATWCGPCISTFPRLRKWHKKYEEEGFVIIGVTRYWGKGGDKTLSPLQEYDFVDSFKEKHKLPYGIAFSKGAETMLKFGVNAYPTTVLLDRKGVVRYIGIGAGAEEVENLEDMIKKVVREDKADLTAKK